jgi:hypothetical protein
MPSFLKAVNKQEELIFHHLLCRFLCHVGRLPEYRNDVASAWSTWPGKIDCWKSLEEGVTLSSSVRNLLLIDPGGSPLLLGRRSPTGARWPSCVQYLPAAGRQRPGENNANYLEPRLMTFTLDPHRSVCNVSQ